MNRLKESVKHALADHETIKTQERLAEVLAMSPSQFSRALNNPARRFNEQQREALAYFLGQTAAAITGILRADAGDREELFDKKAANVDFSKIVQLEGQMQKLVEQNSVLQDQVKKVSEFVQQFEHLAKIVKDQAKVVEDQAKKLARFQNDSSSDGSAPH